MDRDVPVRRPDPLGLTPGGARASLVGTTGWRGTPRHIIGDTGVYRSWRHNRPVRAAGWAPESRCARARWVMFLPRRCHTAYGEACLRRCAASIKMSARLLHLFSCGMGPRPYDGEGIGPGATTALGHPSRCAQPSAGVLGGGLRGSKAWGSLARRGTGRSVAPRASDGAAVRWAPRGVSGSADRSRFPHRDRDAGKE